jgi:hypothetical protein
MRRSAAIASGATLLLACAFAAQAQEKISDGVVKIGMLEGMSSIYASNSDRIYASRRIVAKCH